MRMPGTAAVRQAHDGGVLSPSKGAAGSRGAGRVWGTVTCALVCTFLPAGCGEKADRPRGPVVERGPFPVVHEEEGELAALKTLTISTKIRGQLVFVVEDLDHVEKDDVLIELDKSELESSQKRTQDELAATRKKLEEDELDLQIRKAQVEVDLEKRAAARALAEVRLETARRGAEPDDITIARKNVEAARVARDFARSSLDDARALAENGFVAESELADETYNLELGSARFEKARLRLEKLLGGPTPHELKPAELELEQADIEFRIAREEAGSSVSGLEQAVAWSRAEVWRFEERLKRIEWELKQCTIKAPRAGLALRVERPWEKRKVDAGMRTWPGIGLVELPELAAFKVKTQIPESVIRHFEVGDEVPVTIDGLDGEVSTGKLTWIDAWARDKNARLAEADQKQEGLSGVRVFAADVALDETDERMKLGSSAKVELRSVLEDVVFVDRRAVEWRRGRPFVRVLGGDGSVELSPVVLGESNERSCVIVEGAAPGTPVVFRDGG
jgi:HlyD family secretion protein